MEFSFDLAGDSLRIIDVGARVVPGDGPIYKALLGNLPCKVTAVEPDASTNERLLTNPDCDVHNVALGSGVQEYINICNMPSCSSILEPNFNVLKQYSGMEYFYRVHAREPVQTQRFDSYFPAGDFDFLDIDVQGYELEVLRHGVNNLSSMLALHIEVGFVEKYQGQPLFPEVDIFLRGLGFQFHCFTGYGTRAPAGIKVNDSSINGTNQWLWADAVYFHDFSDEEFWSEGNRLLKMAAIFHYVYGSYDFAAAALGRFDRRNQTSFLNDYLRHASKLGHKVEVAVDDEEYLAELVSEINYAASQ